MVKASGYMLYPGMGAFNWYYPSSPPQIPRRSVVHLELGGLIYIYIYMYIYIPAPVFRVGPPGCFTHKISII